MAVFAKLARPAAVLGVMAAVAIIEMVLGGAESGLDWSRWCWQASQRLPDGRPARGGDGRSGRGAKVLAKAEAVAVGYWKGVGIADRWTARALGQPVEWIGRQDRVQAARLSQDRRQWVDRKAQCGILIGTAGLLWRTAFGSLLLLEVFLLS
jgi:hypothetical protein